MGQGKFSCFIRTAGCSLSCRYCDTKYSQDPERGIELTIEEIINKIPIGISKVTLTGGEPLEQKDTVELIMELISRGYFVSLETNGTIDLPFYNAVIENLSIVADYKLDNVFNIFPSSLTNKDYIKFVIGSVEDYEKAKEIAIKLSSETAANIYFSPVFGKVDPLDIIENLKKDKLFFIGINLQLHKLIYKGGKESINLLK